MVNIPSPALAIVGRHNSGKTTLIEQLIAELVARGHDVGSVKHHSHVGFDIDYPGKDSYRHRAAGASETVIAAPGQVARIKTVSGEVECSDIVRSMPGHDIVIVEGYRKSGLPTIELMRSGNEADSRVAEVFAEGARRGWPLGTDFTQFTRGEVPPADDDAAREALRRAQAESREAAGDHFKTQHPDHVDISNKLPTSDTVAVVTDIAEARQAADLYNVPAFALDDIAGLADFVEAHYVRPRVTVVIQAGGESRRMGQSKATVPFAGRPLICRLIERLGPVSDDLVITTNEPDNLAFLHAEFPQYNIQLVCDAFDVRGALQGLYTALQAARNPYVAVVACDMVFASASLVVAEALAMNESGADIVVPVNKHGFEPFHAMYRRMGCLPAVRAALDRGEKRAQSFFGDVDVFEFTQDRVLEAEPMGGCFINANTPEELRNLEESFLEK
ncbi:molybdopterin-guanine dinucleotide biosynthesis protein B [Arabiibacter massiliensis]|uniref:molybdopterin-guanine dinucleotide biosynthesis protein B n=1 Tax=Arabiibacter massiliensis TaxID=1870985 RepID=UPI0009BAF90D|nr:molybdopterin-guanine dinucleotide biosynthesis protein B [Arabiibacter massiliensis]